MSAELLSAALAFFCEKMDMFIVMLTTDITTYNGGGIWTAICNVYSTLLVIGVTLANMFIWIELIESTTKWIEIKKSSVLLTFLIEIVVVNAVIYYSKDILLTVYSIIQGITSSVLTTTGMVDQSGDSLFNISVNQEFIDAVNAMPISTAMVLTIVIVIVSIWICISTIGVVLIVYVRIFNIYLLIAISPLAFACAMSRRTRFVFANFLKNFVSVSIEAVVLVLTLYLFKMLFESGINIDLSSVPQQSGGVPVAIKDYLTQLALSALPGGGAIGLGMLGGQAADYFFGGGNENFAILFWYLIEMSFLFAVMIGMIKGSERIVNKIFGL